MVLENPHRKKLGGQKARGTMKKLWRLICILPPTPLLAHNKPSKHTVNHWIEWCTSWVPDVSTAPINGPVTAIQDLQPDLMAHGKVSVFYDAADDHWAEKVTESSFSPLVVVVVGRSVMSDSLRPMDCSTPGFLSFTTSWSLLKLMPVESVMPSNHLILCHPLLLPPSIFSSIRVFFQWVSSLHQVAKVLELQLQHQFFQWISRVDLPLDWLVWSCCPRDYSLLIS